MNNPKEVYFFKYCDLCENKELEDKDEPCNECLTQGWNEDSHKPICFKEKK